MLAALPEPRCDFQLFSACRHIALAVSGGSDSVALLRLVHRWTGNHESLPQISVLTVDHGLRAESEKEARQVGMWARQLGLAHQILSWSGEKPASGIQSKARKARYDLMAHWCRENHADALLTAHTVDDQAETVLMRLSRTTSPDSLAGIPAQGQWHGLPVLRPLLSEMHDVLRTYLQSIEQQWIEDPSNADPRFERVRVRNSLRSFSGTTVGTERLSALAASCARTVALLDRCVENWLKLWLEEHGAGICYVPIDRFIELPSALQGRIFGRLIAHYGGGSAKPEREELQRLTRWIRQQGPVRCTLGGVILGKRKSKFWITREASRIAAAPLVVPEIGEIVWDGRFLVTAPPGSTIVPAGDRFSGLDDSIPIFARRAYPLVRLPGQDCDGPRTVHVAFLGL